MRTPALILLAGLSVDGTRRMSRANLPTCSFFDTNIAGWTSVPGAFTVAQDPTMGADAPGSSRFTTTPVIVLDTWQTTSVSSLSSPANTFGANVTIIVDSFSGAVAPFWVDDVQLGPAGSRPGTLQSSRA